MFRVVSKISFTQAGAGRTKKIVFDFVSDCECSDGWRDLTNKAKITVPKNVYARDENNKLIALGDTAQNIGGFTDSPLFLRGDQVTIETGYILRQRNGSELQITNKVFDGYVTKVKSKIPIEIECEDNMWLLKQIPAPNKTWSSKKYTLESMLEEMIKGSGLTVNKRTQTTIPDFTTMNETVAEVLARLRKELRFESYFRGKELRCGSLVYIEDEARTQSFAYQKTIISDELEYQRKDDITLSAVAHNTVEQENGTTKDGKKKTKKVRLEVLVTLKNDKTSFQVVQKGKQPDPNTEGERRTLFFPQATTVQQLVDLAAAELKKYYYTGLKGKFTTFGLPLVRMGDNVKIDNPKQPDMNGTYKVREVAYKCNTGGLRQEITLDFKLLQ